MSASTCSQDPRSQPAWYLCCKFRNSQVYLASPAGFICTQNGGGLGAGTILSDSGQAIKLGLKTMGLGGKGRRMFFGNSFIGM